MKYLMIVMLSVLMLSCGAAVNTDFEKGTDFTKYKTYNYYPGIDSGLNQLDDKRVKYALDSLLRSRGYTMSSTPDFVINFYAEEAISNSQSSIGIGVGGGGRNVGGGVSGGIPLGGPRLVQIFTLDFVDTAEDKLVWQAVSEAKYREKATPEQREAYYLAIIQKILNKYPPKSKRR